MQSACTSGQIWGYGRGGAISATLQKRGIHAISNTHGPHGVDVKPGDLVRETRQAKGLTLAELGALTRFSAAQVSRYERGISPLTDVDVLRTFADALHLPHQAFGLVPTAPPSSTRHGQRIAAISAFPRLPGPKVVGYGPEDGEDPVRRRKLLAGMAVTAAAAAVAPALGNGSATADERVVGELLVAGIRDAMLGLGDASSTPPAEGLDADFTRALADFDACRYTGLAVRLPRLIRAGHATVTSGTPDGCGLLARSYLLATRMLIKLDEQQLGWMAADRAHGLAATAGDALAVAESSRQLAVLARKAGWHTEALTIALTAADHPDLRGLGRPGAAERGLLIQSAAYTVARRGDRDGMRELTDEAAAIAGELGGATLLRDHGGGFTPLTVRLHRISAENHAGDPMAALEAARSISLKALPSVERRSRCLSDVAAALERLGRRQDCIRTLLSAEHHAPEETHARPAVKSLVSTLLVTGPTSTELRGLARRSGVLV